ncbi:MAG: motility associated factor glycosyltransferase family protein [Candidatus Omnitrophota bacterium]
MNGHDPLNDKRYHANLTAIKQTHAHLYQVLTSITDTIYRTEPARSGLLTLICRHENQDFYLHSKFKPEDEALKSIQNPKINLHADHFIVLGLGLGYHLQLLLDHKPKTSRVLLIEPNPAIVNHSLKTLDWATLLNRKDFFFCLGTDPNVLAASLQQFIDVTTFESLENIELPSEIRFAEPFFKTCRQTIDNEIKSLLYDFKTRLAEDAVVPRNILKNIHHILHTRPVKTLENRFRGKPGFIVSAGPSLDKNILFLKKIKNRGVIICVDTALKPLLKRGIHPHFTITADPSYKNYLHLLGTESELTYFLVSDTGISSNVYTDFNDHLFSVSLGKPIMHMIEQNIGEIGQLDAWGSVISLALSFAIYIGTDPIVFLGQDFAFTNMRNHCRGTSWEDSWMENSRDLDAMQRAENRSIGGISKVSDTRDIDDAPTMTSDKLLLYKNYLAKIFPTYPKHHFINATEGGILTEIEPQPLHRVLETTVYPQEPIDIQSVFDIPTLYNSENKKKLMVFFRAKTDFFKKYKHKLLDIGDKLKTAETLAFSSIYPLLEEAHQLKNLLYANPQNGDIAEMWSQGPIFEFLKRYKKLEPHGVSPDNAGEWVRLFRDYFEKLFPLISGIKDSFEDALKNLR